MCIFSTSLNKHWSKGFYGKFVFIGGSSFNLTNLSHPVFEYFNAAIFKRIRTIPTILIYITNHA